ncbi:hypothetical protein PR048_015938 [Dryococelus australis]|uniref:Uncharacterized protein n=1 Tax=Dryococelus australis TaxID=614101 RepID=A0ABQ9HIB8_9NEOP|nr:hypothetical protein PR048_015938 [Dryococelus australis]
MDHGRLPVNFKLGDLVLCKTDVLANIGKDLTGNLIPKFSRASIAQLQLVILKSSCHTVKALCTAIIELIKLTTVRPAAHKIDYLNLDS